MAMMYLVATVFEATAEFIYLNWETSTEAAVRHSATNEAHYSYSRMYHSEENSSISGAVLDVMNRVKPFLDINPTR